MRIDIHYIETWARSLGARDSLPEWIRRLILASVMPEKLRMPSGKAVWMPGPDGILYCEEGNQFVPTGRSHWEMGVGEDFEKKAAKDYGKRTAEAVEPEALALLKQTTFVFVTPWLWPSKINWEDKCNKEGKWKNVIVIDGEEFKNWLESSLSVSLQFAAEAKIVPESGLSTPDDAWNEWSGLTVPSISEELVTAGREEQEKDFLGRLSASSGIFTIRGDSLREAWGFALAAIRRINSERDREFISQHRTFSEAHWAVRGPVIDRLDEIERQLRPQDPIDAYRWLFDDWLPDSPSGEQDINSRQAEVDQLRAAAVDAILAANGIDGLVKFAVSCRYPGLVAVSAVRALDGPTSINDLIDRALSEGKIGAFFASNVSGEAFKLYGEAWRDLVRVQAKSGTRSATELAAMILWWPDNRSTWNEAAQFGEDVSKEYWLHKHIFLPEENEDDLRYEIIRLIEVGRAVETFDRWAYHTSRIPSTELLVLFDAMMVQLPVLHF